MADELAAGGKVVPEGGVAIRDVKLVRPGDVELERPVNVDPCVLTSSPSVRVCSP